MRGRAADRRSRIPPLVNVTVRRLGTTIARSSRISVVARLWGVRHPFGALPSSWCTSHWRGLIESVEQRSHVSLVAESDGERAGFVLLIDDLPDEITAMPQGFVAYMAVEPAFRRRGIGRALLDAAEDEARRRGLPYMTLMVTEENAAARALYRRAGYFTERRLLCKPL